jgi:hypothetical protein
LSIFSIARFPRVNPAPHSCTHPPRKDTAGHAFVEALTYCDPDRYASPANLPCVRRVFSGGLGVLHAHPASVRQNWPRAAHSQCCRARQCSRIARSAKLLAPLLTAARVRLGRLDRAVEGPPSDTPPPGTSSPSNAFNRLKSLLNSLSRLKETQELSLLSQQKPR